MIRSKTGSIVVIAAAALLGIFAVRDTAERTSIERIRIEASEAAAPSVEPVSSLQRHDVAAVETTGTSGQGVSVPSVPEVGGLLGNQEENLHPGARVDEATVARLHGDKPLTAEHPHMKSAIEIQERNTAWLMAHPAVVGTAVGLNDKGEVALIVYTKVDAPEIAKAIEGLPVAVFNTGEFFARDRVTTQQAVEARDNITERAGKPSAGPNPATWFARPVPIGVSTGHPDITAGTIGCRVWKDVPTTTGGETTVVRTYYALSNNHVYAHENLAAIESNALQPGPYDGGMNPRDAIGTLSAFYWMVFTTSASNAIDAAIVEASVGNLGNGTPSNGYGTPKSTPVVAAVGATVKKYGRTTRLTQSTVSALNATINVGYSTGTARFVNQIVIGGTKFSKGGDSGSLIVSGSKEPVGLLFAGSTTTTIANPIGAVLSYFGVTVDGE